MNQKQFIKAALDTGGMEHRIERFMNFVEPCPATGCWLWTGVINWKGYGHFGWGTRKQGMVIASRAAWVIFKGEIPQGMCVLHRCDVPACVNPIHLWLGTLSDNMKDCSNKGRLGGEYKPQLYCKRGHALEGNRASRGRCRICFNAWMREDWHRKKALGIEKGKCA